MNLRRPIAYVTIVLVVAAVGVWRLGAGRAPMGVEVAEVRRGPLEVEWSAVGYVEARTASVSAPSIGVVSRVLVAEGDRVHAGQTLAILQHASEMAAADAARAGVRMAEAQHAASSALLEEALAAQAARENRARAELSAARAREAQARTALAQARLSRSAAVEAARAELAAAEASLDDLQTPARPEEVARADAEIKAARAALHRATAELARYEELESSGAASKRDADAAREAHARAAAALTSAEQTAALLRQGARSDQVETARARVRAARAQLRAAEANLEAIGVQEQQVVEAASARTAAAALLAEAIAARRRVAASRDEARAAASRADQSRSSARQAAALLADRRLVAPFSGIVGRRMADPGDMANPGTPLFSIVEDSRTWVMAEVDEQDLAPVRIGQAVTVTAPAYVGREFRCRIERIGGEAVPQTEVRTGARIVRVRVSLDGLPTGERALLKPGMEVHVSGRTVVVPDALIAPSDAIVSAGVGDVVWAVEGDRARRKAVTVGYAGVRETEIRSGLSAGDRVVVGGKESLSDGVRVFPRQAPR